MIICQKLGCETLLANTMNIESFRRRPETFLQVVTPCKLRCPLKIDGWKMTFPFTKWFLCRVDSHSFSGGICWLFWIMFFPPGFSLGLHWPTLLLCHLGWLHWPGVFAACGSSGTWCVWRKWGGYSSHQSIGLRWYDIMNLCYHDDIMKIWCYEWYEWYDNDIMIFMMINQCHHTVDGSEISCTSWDW